MVYGTVSFPPRPPPNLLLTIFLQQMSSGVEKPLSDLPGTNVDHVDVDH